MGVRHPFLTFLVAVLHLCRAQGGSVEPHGIHLEVSDDDPDEVIVFFMTKAPLPTSMVQFGPTKWHATDRSQMAIGERPAVRYHEGRDDDYRSEYLHTVRLAGLGPRQLVYYRVGHPDTGWSRVMQFRARTSDVDSTVKIVAFGDQDVNRNTKRVIDEILEDKQDYNFILLMGDISYADGKQEEWDEHADLTQPLYSQVQVAAAIGNHEEEWDRYEAYDFRWRHPKNEANRYWFSIVEGPVRVFALSCEHDISPGSEQHRWLEKMLMKANEPDERKRVPWIVGSHHMPGYTSGMHRESQRIIQALDATLRKYNVNLMLYGHAHTYERIYPVYNGERTSRKRGELSDPYIADGPFDVNADALDTIHIVVGTGGRSTRSCREQKSYSNGGCIRTHGFGVLEANRDMLTWTFKDDDGRIKDAMRICSLEGCKSVPKSNEPSASEQDDKTNAADGPGRQTEATADDGPQGDDNISQYTEQRGNGGGGSAPAPPGWCSWSQYGPEDKGFSGWCQATRDSCDKCKGLWCSEGDDDATNGRLVPESQEQSGGPLQPSKPEISIFENNSANGTAEITVMADPAVECTMKKPGESFDFEQYRPCAACQETSGVVCSPTGVPVAPSMCIAVECLKIDRNLLSSKNCLQTP